MNWTPAFAFTYVTEFFEKVGFHGSGARSAAVEGVERLRALPEIPGLR
jgi:N-acetylglutamate synthase-like GNAT family acetyltransferase